MSASQSNLSSAKYGYDLVVATSQLSINNTLLQMFYEEGTVAPMVTVYYGMDAQGKIYQMDEATILSQTGETSPFTPFSVPAWDGTGTMPSGVAALNNSDFYMGFQAQLGINPNWDLSTVPNIVNINPGAQTVQYNMLCATFQIVQCTFGRRGIINYLNVSQDDSEPWVFTSNVPLTTINNDKTNLTTDVQNAVNVMPGEFSVQKLLLDLDNAALESTPTISQIDAGSDVIAALNKDFLGEYFSALKANKEPVLNYSIVVPTAEPSTLKITQVDMYADAFTDNGQPVASPTSDQQDLASLNYLCSTNGQLPVPTQFNWNWLENDTDADDFDGIIAVNRNTFAKYFEGILTPIVQKNCYLPHVTVTYESDTSTDYDMSLAGGQAPTVTLNPSGSTVLTYSFTSTSKDQAGLDGDCGKMTLTASMDATVEFSGNNVTITQHLVIYTYVNHLSDSTDGNVVDTTITDVYAITATDDGKLLFARDTAKSSTVDKSVTPSVNAFLSFFNGINDLVSDITKWLDTFIPTAFTDIPVSGIQGFIFPGGKTFSFKAVNFSDNQDLVTQIKYTDPD
jgi:hypothetical protein